MLSLIVPMSSGRLFLDRVARQHCPSPLHRHTQINMHSEHVQGKDDISTLPATRHFYFALTRRLFSLDNLICQCSNTLVLDVEVIQSPQAAAAALDPVRARLLAELSEPASAATLAARLSLPRQKVNYHLRALESHHLVRPTSERKWGGITERLVEATASSYVVSPAAMGPAASDPGRSRDRLSAGYLIALAARVVREVSELATRARETGKRLATLSIDTEIRFRSAAERAQFSSELTAAITQLAARYHDASALGGRTHRLVLVAHPLPQKNKETAV
jgi:DNA-binding transcriptional ArsR family regulator